MKRENGFTLIELLVSLLMLTIVVGLTLIFFTKQLQLTTSQSRISESSQEVLSAVETLRRDIETAGYGLPWDMAGASYSEAKSQSHTAYNDAPSNAPRAIIIDNANSYLVLKGSTFSYNKASKHWGAYDSSGVFYNGFSNSTASDYTNLNRFVKNDYAIILTAGTNVLIRNGLNWSYKYNGTSFPNPPPESNSYLVYGILNSKTGSPKAPFNRIDYYIKTPKNLPANCAAKTKVLYRDIMKSSTGNFTAYPILDCVAGFHIWLGQADSSGTITYSSSPAFAIAPSGADKAADERAKLKIVKVYLLVQNGEEDRNYNFQNSPEFSNPSSYKFTDIDTSPPTHYFDLSGITDWKNYRWKLIKISVIPKNLN